MSHDERVRRSFLSCLLIVLLTACTAPPSPEQPGGEGGKAPASDGAPGPTSPRVGSASPGADGLRPQGHAHRCARPTTAVFIGDSFTVGGGASTRDKRWSSLVARTLNWREVNLGENGTSYGYGSRVRGSTPYSARVEAAAKARPSVVVVTTAANAAMRNQQPGIAVTLQGLRRALPQVPIIATSPFFRSDVPQARLDALGREIDRAAHRDGVDYVDLGYPLRGMRPAPLFDGLHPDDRGYRLIAERFIERAGNDAQLNRVC